MRKMGPMQAKRTLVNRVVLCLYGRFSMYVIIMLKTGSKHMKRMTNRKGTLVSKWKTQKNKDVTKRA